MRKSDDFNVIRSAAWIAAVLLAVVVGLVVPFLFFEWVVIHLGHVAGIVIYGFLALGYCVIFPGMLYAINNGEWFEDPETPTTGERWELQVGGFGMICAFVVAFSQLCRYLFLAFGGFISAQSDYWHWVMFGLSWVADNLLFNLSQIFGWHLTEIRANTLWSEALVWLFNVVFDLSAIVLAIRILRLTWQRRSPGSSSAGDGS